MTQTLPSYLKHHFLIAMPHMEDPRFAQTLIYLCEHNADGAMGLIINRPSGLNLGDVLEQTSPGLDIPAGIGARVVFNGGPVQSERGFVLHRGPGHWEGSLDLGPLQLTTSRDILVDMTRGRGPRESFVALGYAGWDAGQLERELMDNANNFLTEVTSTSMLAVASSPLRPGLCSSRSLCPLLALPWSLAVYLPRALLPRSSSWPVYSICGPNVAWLAKDLCPG